MKKYNEKTSSSADTVLNVDIQRSRMRLDLLSKTRHDKLSYTSRTYTLDDCGIFDFFDDFFQKRIRFFNSGWNVQRLLLALEKIERKFAEKTGNDFLECYRLIHNQAVNCTKTLDLLSNPMTETLEHGYAFEREATFSHGFRSLTLFNLKRNIFDIGESLFHAYYDENYKNELYVCLDRTDDNELSFYMDDIVNMPLLFRYHDFALSYLNNLIIPYVIGLKEATFKPKVEIIPVKPDSMLQELLDICDENGNLKKDNSGIFENCTETLEFTKDFIEGKFLSSIIAH